MLNSKTIRRIELLFEAWLLSFAVDHLPAGTEKYKSFFVRPLSPYPGMGIAIMMPPVNGVLIYTDHLLTVIRTSDQVLVGVATMTLVCPFDIHLGQVLCISPTRLYDADGLPLNEFSSKGGIAIIGMRRASLGLDEACTTTYTRELVHQLETLPIPDELRTISAMLIKAGARAQSSCVIEDEDKGLYGLTFMIANERFQGKLGVFLDLARDLYRVELTSAGEETQIIENVYFDNLGEVLCDAIDDGTWLANTVSLVNQDMPQEV